MAHHGELVYEHHNTIESTHLYAKGSHAAENGYQVITAGQMTGGVGTRSHTGQVRKWLAPLGGLYMTVIPPTCVKLTPDRTSLLSLAVGCTVFHAIKNVFIEYEVASQLEYKWPNDIVCNGKKLSGILCESVHDTNGTPRLLLSVGVNIVPVEFNEAFRSKEVQKDSGILEPTWMTEYVAEMTESILKPKIAEAIKAAFAGLVVCDNPQQHVQALVGSVGLFGINKRVKIVRDGEEDVHGVLESFDVVEGIKLKNKTDFLVNGRLQLM